MIIPEPNKNFSFHSHLRLQIRWNVALFAHTERTMASLVSIMSDADADADLFARYSYKLRAINFFFPPCDFFLLILLSHVSETASSH